MGMDHTTRYTNRAVQTACLVVLMAAVAGCGDVRRSLGIDRTAPDEFAVVERAPLSVPPDFTLRPPQPGAPRPGTKTPREQAARAVFGRTDASERSGPELFSGGNGPQVQAAPRGQVAALSPGEAALLRQAGADEIDPDIRAKVDQETTQLAAAERSFTDFLIFWRDPPPPGVVVDPVAEQARLRENAALDRPVTEGETPIIERREKAPLEGLFR